MTIPGLLTLIATLILGGLISIPIGGIAAAANPYRYTILLGLMYSAITAITYSFYGTTMTFTEPKTVFDWSFTPILPSTGVYLGLLIFILLVTCLIIELRKSGLTNRRVSLSAIIGYGTALAATLIAIWIPFRIQRVMMDAFSD